MCVSGVYLGLVRLMARPRALDLFQRVPLPRGQASPAHIRLAGRSLASHGSLYAPGGGSQWASSLPATGRLSAVTWNGQGGC